MNLLFAAFLRTVQEDGERKKERKRETGRQIDRKSEKYEEEEWGKRKKWDNDEGNGRKREIKEFPVMK